MLGPVITSAPHNRYCGPAVISAVTGWSAGYAAALIRKRTGRRAITGVTVRELLQTLALDHSLQVREIVADARPVSQRDTLAHWLDKSPARRDYPNGLFIIAAGWHWMAVQHNAYVCSQTQDVVTVKHPAVKRRARVSYVLRILP